MQGITTDYQGLLMVSKAPSKFKDEVFIPKSKVLLKSHIHKRQPPQTTVNKQES